MRRWLLAVLVVAVPQASPLPAQEIRVSGATSVRYIELREFLRDSVTQASTDGSGLLRQLPDGRIVRCVPGEAFCYQVTPGDILSTVPVIHDVNVSAWGLAQGLQLNAQVRGRSSLGSANDLWPREDEHLELLTLYADLQRNTLRLRAGRQWRTSGLGFYNFDGISAGVRRGAGTLLEAWVGRSLTRGLNEPRTGSALESVEALSAANAGLLFGAQGRFRPSRTVQVGAVYQMDIRGDRRGAYSELFAADGVARTARGTVEGSFEVDVAGRALNHARLSYRTPVFRNLAGTLEVRRYHPYFELWTIWGAFSPVGFDEGRAGLTWATPTGTLIARGEATWRRYGDASTESVDDFRTTGWGMSGSLAWLPRPDWRLSGSYRLESGFGAARWDSQLSARHDISDGTFVALQAIGFQRLYEFRLSEGTVVGLGSEGATSLGDRVRVLGSLMIYRQHGGLPTAVDWNQRRASVRIEWTAGREPAAVTGGARR